MKYKIKFKAQDANNINQIIIDKLASFGYESVKTDPSDYLQIFVRANYRGDTKVSESIIWLHLSPLEPRLVSKGHKDLSNKVGTVFAKVAPFTKEELRLFDSLDFDILKSDMDITGQKITDWVIM